MNSTRSPLSNLAVRSPCRLNCFILSVCSLIFYTISKVFVFWARLPQMSVCSTPGKYSINICVLDREAAPSKDYIIYCRCMFPQKRSYYWCYLSLVTTYSLGL